MPDNKTALLWKLLYGVEMEEIPDPNKQENRPYIKAKNKQRIEAFKYLMQSPAKVLFESWADRIMRKNIALLCTPKDACNCPSCTIIREIRMMLELWVEAELTIQEEEKNA